jgi:hypothetical protein
MTEPECLQVYQELVTMLQDFQLGWVVERVEAQVEDEKLIDVESLNTPVQGTSQAVLTKPEIYTAQEQLLLLINAVERLVIGSMETEGALVDFLAEETTRLQSPVTLEFESDDVPALTPDDEGLEERRPAIAELKHLLQVLRQEAFSGVD